MDIRTEVEDRLPYTATAREIRRDLECGVTDPRAVLELLGLLEEQAIEGQSAAEELSEAQDRIEYLEKQNVELERRVEQLQNAVRAFDENNCCQQRWFVKGRSVQCKLDKTHTGKCTNRRRA
jgi:predicted RNase H-like nuclease (RuvC/YqgF family)